MASFRFDLLRYQRAQALRVARRCKQMGRPADWISGWVAEARAYHRQIMRRVIAERQMGRMA